MLPVHLLLWLLLPMSEMAAQESYPPLEGRVIDDKGKPVEGAEISLYSQDLLSWNRPGFRLSREGWARPHQLLTRSLEDGKFTFRYIFSRDPMPRKGPIQFLARHPGMVGIPSESFQYPSALPGALVLSMVPERRVSGKLLTNNAAALEQLWVLVSEIHDLSWLSPNTPLRAYNFISKGEWAGSLVAADGSFSVGALRAGSGQIHVCIKIKGDGRLQNMPIMEIACSLPIDTTAGDQRLDIDIDEYLMPRTVRLETANGGAPTRGAVCSFADAYNKNYLWFSTPRAPEIYWERCRLSGESSFSWLAPVGTQMLRVVTGDYATELCKLEGPSTTLHLKPARTINIVLRIPEGSKILGGELKPEIPGWWFINEVMKPIIVAPNQTAVPAPVPGSGYYPCAGFYNLNGYITLADGARKQKVLVEVSIPFELDENEIRPQKFIKLIE